MWVMPSLALALLSPLQETNGHADSELARRLQLLEERVRALEAERDRLALENRSLTEKLAQSDQELVRLAREVIRLNERGRAGSPAGLPPGEEASAVPAERVPTNGTAPEGPIPREGNAPEQDIRGEISYVDRAGGFMVLNRGREHEVRIGYRFEILRDPTGEARRLGIARVSKFMGKTDQLSQLVLVEGRLEEIKEDDIAVAIRKAVEVPDPPGTTSQPAEKKGFRVEGIAGDNYFLNYGSIHGAMPTARVWVQRKGKTIAILRLDQVDKDYSIAALVEREGDVAEGDSILTEKPRRAVAGIVVVNDGRGIMLDVGLDKGAEVGMIFEAQRSGQPVGRLRLSKVEKFISYAEAVEGAVKDQFKVKDSVEQVR